MAGFDGPADGSGVWPECGAMGIMTSGDDSGRARRSGCMCSSPSFLAEKARAASREGLTAWSYSSEDRGFCAYGESVRRRSADAEPAGESPSWFLRSSTCARSCCSAGHCLEVSD